MSRRRAQKAVQSQRAAAGGGRAIALSPQAHTPGAQGDDFFGPGTPISPIAPSRLGGRRFDYQFGFNYNITPRQNERVSFATLRGLARTHDITRLCIETRKDQMSRLKFTFGIVDSEDDLSDEQNNRAIGYKKLLRRPDGRNFWGDWLRMVLEDLLVIDAPAIYVQRTNGGEIIGLEQIDGATIKPVLDDGGRTPMPPQTAYQQIIKGMPAWNYTTQDLVYRPRNQLVESPYGFSPVEQIIATINLALRRQIWQHAYFTDGNLPDSLIGVPSTWTPDQIRDFQTWFDSMLSGNSQKRRGGLFVPGEVAKSYVPTKEAEMFGAAEDWLARVVCFCFGVSHQALVKEVNRATAATAQEQALEDGLAPIMAWVKSLIDGMLLDMFDETELEFRWVDDKEQDPTAQNLILQSQRQNGVISGNEWRAAIGMEPDPDPEMDRKYILTTVQPMNVQDQIDDSKAKMDAMPPPPPQIQHVGPDGKLVPAPNAAPADGKRPSTGTAASSASGGADGEGGAAKSASSDHHHHEEVSTDRRPFAGADAAKSSALYGRIGPRRPEAERLRQSLETILQRGLARVGARVVAAVERVSSDLSTKAVGDDPAHDEVLRAALDAVGSFDFLIDPTADVLAELAADTSRETVALFGSTFTEEMTDQVSQRSVAIARDRAAEMVGRRVLDDGSIVDNPSAEWAISDATRNMIRETITSVLDQNLGSDALIQSLQDDHAFSPARAEMVSRTEIASINSDAAMETYHEAQDAGVSVGKEWYVGPESCDICLDNAAAGVIELDDTFPSGDDDTPAHPNCTCAVLPVVRDEE